MADFNVERVDVWAAGIKDSPGGLARVLKGLREAGADLDFIVARRSHEKRGAAVVFVTPLRGDREIEAAATLGFNVVNSVKSVRVEGKNKPGVAAAVMARLASSKINVRGVSAGVIGRRFILYVGFDSAKDATKAVSVLRRKG